MAIKISERDLEDYVVENIHEVNPRYEYLGRQVPVLDKGIIDVLAKTPEGFAIIELKVVKIDDAAIGQITRYRGGFRMQLLNCAWRFDDEFAGDPKWTRESAMHPETSHDGLAFQIMPKIESVIIGPLIDTKSSLSRWHTGIEFRVFTMTLENGLKIHSLWGDTPVDSVPTDFDAIVRNAHPSIKDWVRNRLLRYYQYDEEIEKEISKINRIGEAMNRIEWGIDSGDEI